MPRSRSIFTIPETSHYLEDSKDEEESDGTKKKANTSFDGSED